MQLPKAIAHWAGLLRIFPSEIALELGKIMQKVSLLIGPPQQDVNPGNEEPDGYEGVTRSGRYERLLLSEWLMADEIPEEFLRRAIMNEHQFYKLKTQSNQGASFAVVLFDTGPLQLGCPRVVQIAILLLLYQRANLNNTVFAWGSFQHPELGLQEKLDESVIQSFLARRDTTLVTEEIVCKWQDILKDYGELSELWFVGGKSLNKYTNGNQLQITESIDRRKSAVIVESVMPGKKKQVEISLPEQNILVNILRNPFKQKINKSIVTKKALGQGDSIIFSDNGRKLAVKLDDGSVAVYSIPNSPKEKVAKAKYFIPADSQSVVAVTIKRKRLMIITVDDQKMYFHRFPELPNGKTIYSKNITQNVFPKEEQGSDCTHFIFNERQGEKHIWFLDDKKRLRTMQWSPEPGLFSSSMKDVIGVARTSQSIVCVQHDVENRECKIVEGFAEGKTNSKIKVKTDMKKPAVFFYNTLNWTDYQQGIVALQQDDKLWRVINNNKQSGRSIDRGCEVIGVVTTKKDHDDKVYEHGPNVALVAVNKGKNGFLIIDGIKTSSFKAKGQIRQAYVCQTKPYIAYRTETNDLCVYALNHEEHVMHIISENANG